MEYGLILYNPSLPFPGTVVVGSSQLAVITPFQHSSVQSVSDSMLPFFFLFRFFVRSPTARLGVAPNDVPPLNENENFNRTRDGINWNV